MVKVTIVANNSSLSLFIVTKLKRHSQVICVRLWKLDFKYPINLVFGLHAGHLPVQPYKNHWRDLLITAIKINKLALGVRQNLG